jgi:hypothetical protein
MKREEKELLLEDLCARVQYKVKINVSKAIRIRINGKIKEKDLVDTVYGVIFYNDGPKMVTPQNFSFLDKERCNNFGGWIVEMVKPYLRPMSSMTEEESKEINTLLQTDFYVDGFLYPIAAINMINWLNAHHFDYRGLIEKGLALEAPEGMY